KILLIIYTTIFIVILNTAAGVSAIAPNKIRAAQSLGATRSQIFFHVALPATVPYILTGMRLAMANSFTTIVAAELIAANNGLGKMLWDGRLFMLVDDIFVSLVTLGLLGFLVDRMFRWRIYSFAGKHSPTTWAAHTRRTIIMGIRATPYLLALFLFTCATPAWSQTKMTIATGVDPVFSAYYVAQEEGIFKKNGLDVKINMGPSGSAMVSFLINGQIESAFGSEIAGISNHNLDPNVVVVAQAARLVRWIA